MKNYKLKANEVVRIQKNISLQTKSGEIPAKMLLTNLNFIFVTESKKFLWVQPKECKHAFAKETVKVDNGTPVIKQTGKSVTICFTTEDRIITFEDKQSARHFVINAWNVVTGKSSFERGLDKLKQALDLIDEKFDINVLDLVKEALAVGACGIAVNAIRGKVTKFLPGKK